MTTVTRWTVRRCIDHNISIHKLMKTEKKRAMMDGLSCTGVGVVVLLTVAVAQAAAQAGDGFQVADGTADQLPPLPLLIGSSKFPNRKSTFYPPLIPEAAGVGTIPVNFRGRIDTSKDLEKIGGTVVEESDGETLDIGRHSYKLKESVEGVRQGTSPMKGYTGKKLEAFRGEATREGPRHFEASEDVEEIPTSGYEQGDSIFINNAGENKVSMNSGNGG